MFQALLAHFQEALHQQQLLYYVRIMSAGCCPVWSRVAASRQNTQALAPPEDEQVVLETYMGC
jgi:hypothetical protein